MITFLRRYTLLPLRLIVLMMRVFFSIRAFDVLLYARAARHNMRARYASIIVACVFDVFSIRCYS